MLRDDGRVKLIRLALALRECLIEACTEDSRCAQRVLRVCESQTNCDALARADLKRIMCSGLRACLRRVHGVSLPVHNVIIDAVFDIRRAVCGIEESLIMCVVL